tara:strand:+ start:54 stop:611 length:558 start_codon:yes stop_codon:yes gene_type:complete
MAIITFTEIIQFAILTVALGYIFTAFIKLPRSPYEIKTGFNWNDLKFAALISAPAVIFHELGHKFVALAFGLDASFQIWTTGLLIGVVLRAFNSPLIFLAPAYVTIPAGVSSGQMALIAFAGPFVNLLLFGLSILMLKYRKNMSEKETLVWAISKKLNIFLFIFNLIPLGPLDGAKVLTGILGFF